MPGWSGDAMVLLALVGITSACARPPRGVDRRQLVCVAGSLVGVSAITAVAVAFVAGWQTAYLLYTAAVPSVAGALWMHLQLNTPLTYALAVALAVTVSLVAELIPPGPASAVIAIAMALGVAASVCALGSPRACMAAVVGLAALDVALWRSGMLDRIHVAAVSSNEIPLHAAAAVTVGNFTIGGGDFVIGALAGTFAFSVLPARAAAVIVGLIQPTLLMLIVLASFRAEGPLPATSPACLCVMLAWLLSRQSVQHRSVHARKR